jgi:CubicO group peptidase (beta-lactamase class C family)
VVEKVSGKAFGEFLQERILSPLGMSRTAYEPEISDKRLATGYTSFALSPPEKVAPEGSGWLGGAGAIYSTPGDLVKWDLALIEGKVLKPELYHLMTTSRQLSNGKMTGYGCGLAVGAQDGRTILRHGGAVSGFNAFNAMIPSTRSAIVLLCNKDGGLRSLPDTLMALVLKEESNIPKISGLPALETVKKVFAELQSGKVNRAQFGQEFNLYLSDQKVAAAAQRLKSLGTPKSLEVVRTSERGGMEVSTTRLEFGSGEVDVLMYRMPNGIIEQFFANER